MGNDITMKPVHMDYRHPPLGYAVRLVTGGDVQWNELTNLTKSHSVKASLGQELAEMGVENCYITRDGLRSERVISTNLFDDTITLEGGPKAHRCTEGANAVWLAKPKDAYVDLANDRILFCASTPDGHFMAGRYSSWMAQQIANAFKAKEVDLSTVTITCFFKAPVGKSDRVREFETACAHVGLPRVIETCQLPLHGDFPYSGYGKGHKVGIIARI